MTFQERLRRDLVKVQEEIRAADRPYGPFTYAYERRKHLRRAQELIDGLLELDEFLRRPVIAEAEEDGAEK